MEIWAKISAGAVPRLINGLLFCAMFSLPWINEIRVATFLLIAAGLISAFFSGDTFDYAWYKRQFIFWAFLTYYLLQVVALCLYPADAYTHADVERKASFLFIPIVFCFLAANENAWENCIAGFILGNLTAAACCLAVAISRYSYTKDASVFFYHQYAQPTGMSAIYLSLYLLLTLGYIVQLSFRGAYTTRQFAALACAAVFLFGNILLLSSKTIIAAGVVLLSVLFYQSIEIAAQKILAVAVICALCFLVVATANPIRKRYADVDFRHYARTINTVTFDNFTFDGLSLRLVLWRIGAKLINEDKSWLFGEGGERYHRPLNNKLAQFHVYTGDGTSADTGYTNYNMHNQYMESYVQFGVLGIASLLTMIAFPLYCALCNKNNILLFATALFAIASVTESILERQSGILLFTIIISGEWTHLRKKRLRTSNCQ